MSGSAEVGGGAVTIGPGPVATGVRQHAGTMEATVIVPSAMKAFTAGMDAADREAAIRGYVLSVFLEAWLHPPPYMLGIGE